MIRTETGDFGGVSHAAWAGIPRMKIIPPSKGCRGMSLSQPDGTFQQDTPAAQWLLPLSRAIFVGVFYNEGVRLYLSISPVMSRAPR